MLWFLPRRIQGREIKREINLDLINPKLSASLPFPFISISQHGVIATILTLQVHHRTSKLLEANLWDLQALTLPSLHSPWPCHRYIISQNLKHLSGDADVVTEMHTHKLSHCLSFQRKSSWKNTSACVFRDKTCGLASSFTLSLR